MNAKLLSSGAEYSYVGSWKEEGMTRDWIMTMASGEGGNLLM